MQKPTNYILTLLLGLLMTFGTTLVSNAQQQGGGNNSNNSTDTEMLTHIFSTLDGTKTNTGYLWDKTGYPEVLDSVIFKHTRDAKQALTTKSWNAFAQALEFANVDTKRAYKGLSAANPLQRADSNLVDFRMMAVKVDKIKENAFKDNLLLVDTVKKHIYDVPNASESPYEEKTIFLASLSHQTVFGKTVYFKIDESLLMGNLTPEEKNEFFSSLRLSAGDCNGDLPMLRNEIVAYTYPDYGTRRLKMKATVNGIQMESHFLLTLSSATSRYEDNTGTWQDPPIIASLPDNPICGDGHCQPAEMFVCEADCGKIPIPTDVKPVDDCPDVTEVDVVIPTKNCGDVVYGGGNGRKGCTIRNGNELIAAAKWDYEIAPRRPFSHRRSGGHNNLEDKIRAGAYIFLSNDNILNRPVILLDGYVMIDECGYSAVGEVGGRFNEFANELLNRGYDVIYLNYEYMGNYVENNAAILRELLVDVNTAKLQNAAEYGVPIEQNVVLGFSLGGIISRYELARMETENIDHDTRLYISMDTPHKGANIPIGIQHAGGYVNEIIDKMPRYLPGILDNNLFRRRLVLALGFTFRVLDSQWFPINGENRFPPLWRSLVITSDFLEQTHGDHAAQQYLKYHTFHDVNTPNPEYEALQAEFRRMGTILGNTGYPTCEKVAIINGDGRGRSTIDNPNNPDNPNDLGLAGKEGFEFFDFDAEVLDGRLGTRIQANLAFSPVIPQQRQRVSYFQMKKYWFGAIPDRYTREDYANPRASYDLSPGSFIRTDIANGLQADFGILGINFFSMETTHQPDHFTFVPSVSAADINMPDGNHNNNLYLNYNLQGDAIYTPIVNLTTYDVVDRNRCPFDRIYPTGEIFNPNRDQDNDNYIHGTDVILDANRTTVLFDNHFPVITNSINELYDASASNIQFRQEDIRRRCDQQNTFFDIVLNDELLAECRNEALYSWFIDGVFITQTTNPSLRRTVDPTEIPRNGVASTIPHTLRVIIEKTPNTLASPIVWLQMADISRTYYIGYATPITDCNGSDAGMGKIAIKDKEVINSQILLFPNPTNTEFSLKSPLKIKEVTISNSLGQVLLTTKESKTVSITSFSKGIYIVHIVLENGEVQTKKLIIN